MNLKHLIPFLVVILTVSSGCDSSVTFPPGVLAPDAPRQTRLDKAPVFIRDDYLIRAVARFEVDARVLGRERYRFDRSAGVSPLDLALGWGPMSDQSVMDQISVTQSRRFYWWRVKQYPIPRKQIIENSANMHMIPANESVRKTLLSFRNGDLIQISGYLVNVTNQDGFQWRSSTKRTDTGNGACEIVYVEQAIRTDPPV